MTDESFKRAVKLTEMVRKDRLLCQVLPRLKMLKINGVETDKIIDVLISLDLPLRYNLFIKGNFSDLMNLKYTANGQTF